MKNKTIYPLALFVFATASCQDDSKYEHASEDEKIIMTVEDNDLLLVECLKSDILQDRLWASEFASTNSGERELPTQTGLINNQELYLRWFDQLSPDAKEQVNAEFTGWIQTRSPVYWRSIKVSEHEK